MNSVLIIGMGILGQHLAAKMQALGNHVMIADKDEDIIQELSSEFQDCFVGDCTVDAVIRSLGVSNFDYCFVAIGENSYDSLEITSLLKELGAKHVISKARKPRQAEFLKRIGADEVFYPEEEIAEKLAVRYNSKNIFDYKELTSEYSIFETSILAEWVGKTIANIDVRKAYHINIIAIKRGASVIPAPGGTYEFHPEDHIVVIGKSSDVFRLSSKT